MSTSLTVITCAAGVRYALVPSSRRARWGAEDALRILDELEDDPRLVDALARMVGAQDSGSVDREEIARRLAEQIERGGLIAIALDEPRMVGLRPIFFRSGAAPLPGTAEIVPLSSLRETEPTLEYGWVSIEIVDGRGRPFAGFELSLVHADGRRDRVVLDAAGRHTARRVLLPGPSRIELPARVELPAAAANGLAMDGFVRGADDIAVARKPLGPIVLTRLDRHYRLVVELPAVQPTVSFRGALFNADSSCPTAGVADLVPYAQESASKDPFLKIGVFGHADSLGDEASNKLLSDRRSEVAYSLLTGNLDLFREVAAQEQWGAGELQSMLRAIGCNPGAIDGEPGQLTTAAVREFRRNYNQGVFHPSPSRPRAHGPLPDGDELDAATRDAVLDAFHAHHGITLPADRFLGPGRSGCGEFNRTGHAAGDRRVSLAIYGADAPESAEFPCKHGDVGACDIDDQGALRCRFYRERIGLDDTPPGVSTFWDFEWLSTPTGKVHLSALTSLPDSNAAEISVQLVVGGEHEDDEGHGALPSRGPELARLPGLIRSGVIYGLWEPPDGYDPFLPTCWFRAPDDAEGEPWKPAFRPPVFGVWSEGRWGFGAAPGHRADRMRFDREPDWPIVVMSNDGKIRLVPDAEALRSLGTLHVNGLAIRRGK